LKFSISVVSQIQLQKWNFSASNWNMCHFWYTFFSQKFAS